MQLSEESTQETQRHCHNVVTNLNDWLYRLCQIAAESSADVSWERCGNVKKRFCINAVAKLWQRYNNYFRKKKFIMGDWQS